MENLKTEIESSRVPEQFPQIVHYHTILDGAFIQHSNRRNVIAIDMDSFILQSGCPSQQGKHNAQGFFEVYM